MKTEAVKHTLPPGCTRTVVYTAPLLGFHVLARRVNPPNRNPKPTNPKPSLTGTSKAGYGLLVSESLTKPSVLSSEQALGSRVYLKDPGTF